MLLQANF